MSRPSCSSCGRSGVEIARSDRLRADVCLRCYGKAAATSIEGATTPCPSCGELRGGRYRDPASRRMLCWPCWEKRNPTPRKRRKPRKPESFAQLHARVWQALERNGEVFVMGGGRLAGYCPACGEGSVSIWVIRNIDPPRIRTDGCSAGCVPDLIFDSL